MASEVKWIKIVTDIFDDEKILLIESMPERDSIIVIWFKLLCMAGKQNNGGVFMLNDRIAYTDEMLSTIFRRPLNTVRMALKAFENFGMIEIVNDVITIPNWEKHQSLDRIEKGREQAKKRMAAMRERQRQIALKENTVCDVTQDVTQDVTRNSSVTGGEQLRYVTAIEREGEGEREGEKRERKKERETRKTAPRFATPTLQEIKDYCFERKNNVDAERFFDYYSANGWVQGKGKPIKDWKACVRTWERNQYGGNTGSSSQQHIDRSAPDAYDVNKLLAALDDAP